MIDRAGERHGRLVVVSFVDIKKGNYLWTCACDCGNTIITSYQNLSTGNTKSCGCFKLEGLIKRSTKHGLSGGHGNYTRLYRIWLNMRRRCLNKKNGDYKYYGARGIVICKEWDDYKTFHDWANMNGYAENLTIERIDNNGNYAPDNCGWVTRKEQARNTRKNRFLTFNGETKPLSEWAEQLKIPRQALVMRLWRGWSVEKSLTAPIKNII